MVNRTEKNFVDMGNRLRAIRTELQLTSVLASKESGLSRSYISDFEKGFRRPTAKYMQYLHDHHNVNLNYIFSGKTWMFQSPEKKMPPDFGELQLKVDKMLQFLSEIPHALYSTLAYVDEYKIKNKDLIEMHQNQKKTEARE